MLGLLIDEGQKIDKKKKDDERVVGSLASSMATRWLVLISLAPTVA